MKKCLLLSTMILLCGCGYSPDSKRYDTQQADDFDRARGMSEYEITQKHKHDEQHAARSLGKIISVTPYVETYGPDLVVIRCERGVAMFHATRIVIPIGVEAYYLEKDGIIKFWWDGTEARYEVHIGS